jgi:hypothetical protein
MRRLRLPLTFLLFVSCAAPAWAAQKGKPKKLPKFNDVTATVRKELAKHDGYRDNDILTSEWVAKALDAVEKKTGWKIEDAAEIAGKFLSDSDDLVRQLRTRKGMPFMRRFSGTPRAFDRIDRLRGLPMGKRRIPELINNPGGHTLILYMATTEGGRNMGLYLGNVRGGKNFNKPTGRLYTEKQLVDRLEESYNREVKYRKFGRPKKKAAKRGR